MIDKEIHPYALPLSTIEEAVDILTSTESLGSNGILLKIGIRENDYHSIIIINSTSVICGHHLDSFINCPKRII